VLMTLVKYLEEYWVQEFQLCFNRSSNSTQSHAARTTHTTRSRYGSARRVAACLEMSSWFGLISFFLFLLSSSTFSSSSMIRYTPSSVRPLFTSPSKLFSSSWNPSFDMISSHSSRLAPSSLNAKIPKKQLHSLISNIHPDPSEMNVRVRFAPSPTGSLHIGGARTALFNFLFAQRYHGKFIVRVEDTDEERSTKESEISILNDLKWLGLHWDEGPEINGPCAPYRQSERKEIYMKCAQQLIDEGHAYRCFCTEEELEAFKNQSSSSSSSAAAGTGPGPAVSIHFQSPWRDASQEKINAMLSSGAPFTIRFKTPKKKMFVDDIVRGHVAWDAQANIGDFIIMRSNGVPVYNFCVAVDDVLMNISHVIRAEEHLSNTLRQLLIIDGLHGTPPIYAHCSLILGSDRSKLSKRHGATSLSEFKKEGYLPEALVNYLANLGWNDGTAQEIYSMDELRKAFNLNRLVPSSAMFDKLKLQWINKQHLRKMPRDWLMREMEKVSISGGGTMGSTAAAGGGGGEGAVEEEKKFLIDPNKLSNISKKHFSRLVSLLVDLFLDSSQSLLLSRTIAEEIQTLGDYPLLDTLQSDPKAMKMAQDEPFRKIIQRLLRDWKTGKLPLLFTENNFHPNETPIASPSQPTTPSASSSKGYLFNPNWDHYVVSVASELSISNKKVFHPLRLALTGRMKGADVGGQLEILQLLEPVMMTSSGMKTLGDRMKVLEKYLQQQQQNEDRTGSSSL
jgi:glutamyl-tRNA synthetase